MRALKLKLPWRRRPKSFNPIRESWLGKSALYAPHEMAILIAREQERSNRTGRGFSLLVVSTKPGENRNTLLRAANFLTSRIRLTDDIGWLDQKRLCVLLPCTAPSGAHTVAEAVRDTFRDLDPFNVELSYYGGRDEMDQRLRAVHPGTPSSMPAGPSIEPQPQSR
jgi:hypothetical protein